MAIVVEVVSAEAVSAEAVAAVVVTATAMIATTAVTVAAAEGTMTAVATFATAIAMVFWDLWTKLLHTLKG